MLRAVKQDLRANINANSAVDGTPIKEMLRVLVTARMWAVIWFRVSQQLGSRAPIAASLVKQLNQLLTGADLAWQAQVGGGLILYHPQGVVIGEYVVAGTGLTLQQGVTVGGLGGFRSADEQNPTIGHDVALGAGSRVIGDVEIHDRCRVGANAVVVRSSPGRGAIARGVPARWNDA